MFTKTYKVFLMLAVFVILGLAMPAQAAGWVSQSSGTAGSIKSIDMYNATFGFAVGLNNIFYALRMVERHGSR